VTIEHQEVASTLFIVLLSNEKKIMQNAIISGIDNIATNNTVTILTNSLFLFGLKLNTKNIVKIDANKGAIIARSKNLTI